MAGGTELFPDLGRHCSEDTCQQLDFLPFTCDNCKKVFCLEHRTYKAHACPKANLKDNTVIICPVCETRVKTVFGERPETTLKNHSSAGGCNPGLKVTKPKCPVKGCRELLTFSNRYRCKSCGKDVCLKHRYASSHCAQKTSSTGSVCELNAIKYAASGQKTNSELRKSEERLASLRIGKAY